MASSETLPRSHADKIRCNILPGRISGLPTLPKLWYHNFFSQNCIFMLRSNLQRVSLSLSEFHKREFNLMFRKHYKCIFEWWEYTTNKLVVSTKNTIGSHAGMLHTFYPYFQIWAWLYSSWWTLWPPTHGEASSCAAITSYNNRI